MNLKLSQFKDSKVIAKELSYDAIRIYLGIALIGKGYYFMQNINELNNLTQETLSYSAFILSHYIIMAHIVGGLCIALGLITRIAAGLNIPILLGAVSLVHLKEGLFSASQGLEVAMITFFLLSIVLVVGSGKFSLDYYLSTNEKHDILGSNFPDNVIELNHNREKEKELKKSA